MNRQIVALLTAGRLRIDWQMLPISCCFIYGAGGGNFIGVTAGVDVNSGVGDAGGNSDGDSVAVGDCKGTAVAIACRDDVDDAGDDVAGGDLEVCVGCIVGVVCCGAALCVAVLGITVGDNMGVDRRAVSRSVCTLAAISLSS